MINTVDVEVMFVIPEGLTEDYSPQELSEILLEQLEDDWSDLIEDGMKINIHRVSFGQMTDSSGK